MVPRLGLEPRTN